MRCRRSPLVAMALYFLARAGTGQASEAAGHPQLTGSDTDGGAMAQPGSAETLESVPVRLSRAALVEADAGPAVGGREHAAAADKIPPLRFGDGAAAVHGPTGPAEAGAIPTPAFGGLADAADDAAAPDSALFGGPDDWMGGAEQARDSAVSAHEAAAAPGDAALASMAPAGDDAIFASENVERVSDAELAGQRGGFVYQGLDIKFGAEIRSFLGDEMVIQTNFTWNDAVSEVHRTVSTDLTPATLAQLQTGILNGTGLNLEAANGNVFLANQGQTAFIQRTDGALQNIVVNTANNVAVRQEVDAHLSIGNFGSFRANALNERILSSLSAMAGTALVGVIPR